MHSINNNHSTTEKISGASLGRYLISREFWLISFLIAIAGFLLLGLFFYFIMPLITHHNALETVPQLVGKSLDEAKKIINNTALKLDPEIDSSNYIPYLSPLTILQQDPVGLQLVKPGRSIRLRVNKLLPDTILLTSLKDKTIDEVRKTLHAYNLKIGEVKYVPGEGGGKIIKASCQGKILNLETNLVPEYSKIDLVVEQGQGNKKIPFVRVVGMRIGDATARLESKGLGVGQVKYIPESKKEPGTVVRQFPSSMPDDSIQIGSSIDLFVSGLPPDETGSREDLSEDKKETDNTAGKPKKKKPTNKAKDNNY